MRLYLSSYRLGRHRHALVDMLNGNATCAVIANALDYIPAPARAVYQATVYDPVAEMRDMGIDARPLDLRDYWGRSRDLYDDIAGLGLIWTLGGNSFLLRKAMRQSGFDRVIKKLLGQDRLVYGGFSAGSVVACNTLDGIHLMDSPDVTAKGYQTNTIWEGLNLHPHPIIPHHLSDHHESKAAALVVDALQAQERPFTALRDGEVIVTRDGQTHILK